MIWKISICDSLTHFRLNKLPTHYTLEDSQFKFRFIRLNDLDIPTEKWLNLEAQLWCVFSYFTQIRMADMQTIHADNLAFMQ